MFWIPLCVIVGICFLVYNMWREIRRGRVDRELEKRATRRTDFIKLVTSSRMEDVCSNKYRADYDLAYKTVCQCAGMEIPMNLRSQMMTKWIDWAVATEMSEQGKLPHDMILDNLNCWTSDMNERKLVEKYLLGIQDRLRRAGVHATIMYGIPGEFGQTGYQIHQYVQLNQYLASHGAGSTSGNAEIRFAEIL